ncbi:astacin-like metalloendopeptidase [Acanthopagrus latus]|uniref:astacin-like metalloendopeptidase n=1 Tax=Acanthopagrus latus TaxID=8177 RepID=UPI00187C7FFE|nr:astacin-like metalloendopeptidase [Acanthopagrus latus]
MLRMLLAALLFVKSPTDVESGPIQGERQALKEDWFTRVLKYMDSNPETLEELTTKQYAVLEGDMILSTDRNAVASPWPTLEIPYKISSEIENRRHDILSAMAMVSKHTCVSFHPRNNETDYLLFKSSRGCASYVGYIGGQQEVFVGPGCILGNIVHEILHALGFHHEHTRTDRGQYITVLSHNIMNGKERNFYKLPGQTFDLDYDISSIMHYGSGFFSANGLPTIIPHGEMKEMGQRVKMTKLDIERVRRLYHCDTITEEVEKSSAAEKEEDASVHHVLFHDAASGLTTKNKALISANKPEESHTSSSTLSTAAGLQHLNAATRGQENTSRGN